MESKNNNLVIILLVVIIFILGGLCVLFATDTISFNNKVDVNNNKDSNNSKVEESKDDFTVNLLSEEEAINKGKELI